METAAKVLIVGGVLNLALAFVLGFILSNSRLKEPAKPQHYLNLLVGRRACDRDLDRRVGVAQGRATLGEVLVPMQIDHRHARVFAYLGTFENATGGRQRFRKHRVLIGNFIRHR